jgi:hypothetical protein
MLILIQPRSGKGANPRASVNCLLLSDLPTFISSQNALHRPVQSALLHYQLTRDRISSLVINVIDSVSPLSSQQSQNLSAGGNIANGSSNQQNPSVPAPLPSNVPSILSEQGKITEATVQSCCQADRWVLQCNDLQDHQPVNNSPSRYLQTSCPGCFPKDIPPVFVRYVPWIIFQKYSMFIGLQR